MLDDMTSELVNRIVSRVKSYFRPIVRGKDVKIGRPFGEKKKEKDLVRKGTCQSEDDCDGRFFRDTERALRSPEGQDQDEADGNPVTSSSASTRQTWCSWRIGWNKERV